MNNFEKALQLMMQLHALFKQGMGDSDEADEIRERLDPYFGWCSSEPEKRLNSEQRSLINRMSAEMSRHDG